MFRLYIKMFLVLFFVVSLCSCDTDKNYYDKTFELGDGKQIRIYAPDTFEVSRNFEYAVYEDSNLVLEWNISYLPPDERPDFLILKSTDGSIVAVYEKNKPSVIWAIHDFSTHNSWPHRSGNKNYKESNKNGRRLLWKLEDDFPDMKFKLKGVGSGTNWEN